MKILVTGGAGFIASHITDKLVAAGHQVAIIDNLSTGPLAQVNPKARFYEMDIRDNKISQVFEREKPHVVIHHAAQIDVQKSLQDPAFDGDINILGTVNILQNCVQHQVAKVIYASSAAVYGDPRYLPVDEEHPIAPISYYGISKHTPEHYCLVFNQLYGLNYTILRYANVYGPRQDPKGEGGVVSIFVDRLLQKKSVDIYGDGKQTRDFIYVDDIARANLLAITGGDNEIINISCNIRTSVEELFDTMNAMVKGRIKPVYKDARVGDIEHSALDNAKAHNLLRWAPAFNLARGLRSTIEYYQPLYK